MYYGCTMATITLKDIPTAVHRALKKRAKQSGRSLNREIISILLGTVAPQPFSVDDFITEVREHRHSLPGHLSDDLLEEASKTGRP